MSLARKVAEAARKDVGRGYVRMDPDDLKTLGAQLGDVVQVVGPRTTVGKAMPAFPGDRGKGRVHVDGVLRANAGVSVGDSVTLGRIDGVPAQSVTVAAVGVQPAKRDLPYIGRLLDGLPVVRGDRIRAQLFGSRDAEFVVRATQPAGAVVIAPNTRLVVERAPATEVEGGGPSRRPTYEDIGGLGDQLGRIREMIELPLRHPEVFARLGVDAPKGVLLHGPPGTGKTLIARTIAAEAEATFFAISGPEIIHKHYGESEAQLRALFEQARKTSPSIVFLDEVDAIAPSRDKVQGEVEKRVVATLLTLMDGLSGRDNVIVIAATNLPNKLDPALRRPGRFDREIAIPVPDRAGRLQILEIHSRGMPLASDVHIGHLADITHGYVGADLQALCREAAMACLRTVLAGLDLDREAFPTERLLDLEVGMDHFQQALRETEPSAVREVFVDVPNVRWEDIGGLGEVKRELVQAVQWPLDHPELFAAAGVRPPKGILLHGPPGCGKTLLAKAVASQTHVNFLSVKGPELLSRWVGDSEKALREVFRKARQAAPCIVFFDEVDGLVPRRGTGADTGVGDRMLSQFLAEMDGVEELQGVLVLGATNRLDRLDPAALRPGRFDAVIAIPPPDAEALRGILEVHLRDRPLAPGVDRDRLVTAAAGLSGAELSGAVQQAARVAIRRVVEAAERADAPPPDPAAVRITHADLESAIAHARLRERS